jgi:hypothetical protein
MRRPGPYGIRMRTRENDLSGVFPHHHHQRTRAVVAAVFVIAGMGSIFVGEGAASWDGDTDSRRWRTLAVSAALPVALLAWWVVAT